MKMGMTVQKKFLQEKKKGSRWEWENKRWLCELYPILVWWWTVSIAKNGHFTIFFTLRLQLLEIQLNWIAET